MKLSEPKLVTFWIAVILFVIGVIFVLIPAVALYSIPLLVIGFVVLVAGNLLKGL